MKRLLLLVLLATTRVFGVPFLGPVDNIFPRVVGTDVGVRGGIPAHPSTVVNMVTDYGVDNTGATDAVAAVQAGFAAIAATGTPTTIYFPAGTYKQLSPFSIFGMAMNNCLILGDKDPTTGIPTTIWTGHHNNDMFFAGWDTDSNWGLQQYAQPAASSANAITAGRTKGSTHLTIGDSSVFSTGMMVQVAVENQEDETSITGGAVLVYSVKGFGTQRRPMAMITGVPDGTHVDIYPGLPFNIDSGLGAHLNYIPTFHLQQKIGMENIMMEGNNELPGATFYRQMADCWMKNVVTHNFTGFICTFSICEFIQMEHCDVRGNGVISPNHSGLTLLQCSNSLFEDSIFYNDFFCLEANQSCIANVFGYDFFYLAGGNTALNTNHSPHNSQLLIEGSITNSVQIDGFFGSESNSTFYRNWITGTSFLDTPSVAYGVPVSINRFSNYDAFIGNLIGSPNWPYGANGFSFGNPYLGNGAFTGEAEPLAGLYWKGFHDTGTLTTRTNATSGVVTVASTASITDTPFYPGSTTFLLFRLASDPTQVWEVHALSQSGHAITFDSANATLSAEGSAYIVYWDVTGYPEQDRNTFWTDDPTHPGTTTLRMNYNAWAAGGNAIPAGQGIGSDTLPDSYYTTKADFIARGGTWPSWMPYPAFDPLNPGDVTVSGLTRIPAGYRFIHGIDPTDGSSSPTPRTPISRYTRGTLIRR